MQNPTASRSFLLAGAALVLGLSACGDDDSPADGSGGSGGSGSGAPATSTTGNGTTTGSTGSTGTGGGGVVEPGLEIIDLGMPHDLSPDGSIALIQDSASPVGDVYFYDTATKELTFQTEVGDPLRTFASGVSSTRRISALHGEPVEAGLWSQTDDWRQLTSPFAMGCGEDLGGAFDISADGQVVVGLIWNGCDPAAFRWTDDGADGVMTALDLLGETFDGIGSPTNRASVVSDDGLVMAGFAENGPVDRSPAIWRADGSGFMLDPTDQDAPGEVLSISADGSTVAGIWALAGFAWTEADGRIELGTLPTALPSDAVFPNAMSADGSLIFGGVGDAFFTIPAAFVWSSEHGMRNLSELAIAAGITIPEGFVLGNVVGASADGTVLLGVGYDAKGVQKSFVLALPASAYD